MGEVNVHFCPTCSGFHEGTIEFVTQTRRWRHFRFLCGWCLGMNVVVSIRKRC